MNDETLERALNPKPGDRIVITLEVVSSTPSGVRLKNGDHIEFHVRSQWEKRIRNMLGRGLEKHSNPPSMTGEGAIFEFPFGEVVIVCADVETLRKALERFHGSPPLNEEKVRPVRVSPHES